MDSAARYYISFCGCGCVKIRMKKTLASRTASRSQMAAAGLIKSHAVRLSDYRFIIARRISAARTWNVPFGSQLLREIPSRSFLDREVRCFTQLDFSRLCRRIASTDLAANLKTRFLSPPPSFSRGFVGPSDLTWTRFFLVLLLLRHSNSWEWFNFWITDLLLSIHWILTI